MPWDEVVKNIQSGCESLRKEGGSLTSVIFHRKVSLPVVSFRHDSSSFPIFYFFYLFFKRLFRFLVRIRMNCDIVSRNSRFTHVGEFSKSKVLTCVASRENCFLLTQGILSSNFHNIGIVFWSFSYFRLSIRLFKVEITRKAEKSVILLNFMEQTETFKISESSNISMYRAYFFTRLGCIFSF